MKHRIGFNRLGRKASHRKSLHRNMTTSLFRYERIKTTKAKALAIRRSAEKMITRAKEDSVHNRRIVGKDIKDKEVLAKLFTELGPRYKERPGGYTRILKIGFRQGDAAEMVLLELVEEEVDEKKGKKKSSKKTKATEPAKSKTEKKTAEKEDKKAEEAEAPVENEAAEETTNNEVPESAKKDESAEEEKQEEASEEAPEEEKKSE